MSDLQELYQEVILDHNQNPRNFGPLSDANKSADGHNTVCGDQLHVDISIENNTINNIHFSGQGCAISRASASIMTDIIKGKTVDEALAFFESFHDFITKNKNSTNIDLEKLKVFEGVKAYPMRVKCAMLAWHTMKSALKDNKKTISTE